MAGKNAVYGSWTCNEVKGIDHVDREYHNNISKAEYLKILDGPDFKMYKVKYKVGDSEIFGVLHFKGCELQSKYVLPLDDNSLSIGNGHSIDLAKFKEKFDELPNDVVRPLYKYLTEKGSLETAVA